MNTGERILVVDDQSSHRAKMALAVKALGYHAITASDGNEALLKLRSESFDLILLDILMPDMDGFDVMKFLKKDTALKEIPIIVISALDSEMGSVVKAIELGAQDFLPKNFDPVLLKARIDSSLVKKHSRDRELEYLKQVSKLTDAAALVEHGIVNPQRFKLEGITDRDDELGKLARVFTTMAQEVYERERKLSQQVRTLKGIGLLFAIGVVSGLGVVLSRIASTSSPHPFGIVIWVNVITAAICFGSALMRGRLPKLDRRLLSVFLLWAIFAAILGESIIFTVAQHLQASYLSLILVCEGFIVFAFASIMKIEKATLRRLIGFMVGLTGVALVIYTTHGTGQVSAWHWALLALIAPLGYALRTLLITMRLPDDIDIVAATGWCSFFSVLVVLPIAYFKNDFVPLQQGLQADGGILVLALLLFGIISAVGVSSRVHLIRSAGAVFASQSSFVITFAGIAWSMILLGEKLPGQAWMALAILVVGLLLVGPKEEAEEIDPLTKIDHEL